MQNIDINRPITITDKVQVPKTEYTEQAMRPQIRFSFACLHCGKPNTVNIVPFQPGMPLDALVGKNLVSKDMVVKNGLAKPAPKHQRNLGGLVLQNMPALCQGLACGACQTPYLLVYGFGETQPGRVMGQVPGLWRINFANTAGMIKIEDMFGAIRLGKPNMVKEFLAQSPGLVDGFINGERTGLMEAAIVGNSEIAKMYLDKGADPNIKDKGNSFAAIHYAVQNHFFDIVKMLLEKGAEVNIQDGYGKNPIMTAVFNRKKGREIIDLLLAHGADKTQKNHSNVSAEILAKRFKFEF